VERERGSTGKGQEGTFQNDENILHLDRSLDYKNLFICQNTSNSPFRICALLNM
jgi:phosphoribosylpyrophosphate synthetase